ncbi:MAG: hypothetical protein ACTHOO_07600 [Alcanivorax sp.]
MEELPSLLEQTTADICINKEDDTVTILHADPFEDALLELQYIQNEHELIFQFEDYQLSFGITLDGEFETYLTKVPSITLLLIDMETNTAESGVEVPLRLK